MGSEMCIRDRQKDSLPHYAEKPLPLRARAQRCEQSPPNARRKKACPGSGIKKSIQRAKRICGHTKRANHRPGYFSDDSIRYGRPPGALATLITKSRTSLLAAGIDRRCCYLIARTAKFVYNFTIRSVHYRIFMIIVKAIYAHHFCRCRHTRRRSALRGAGSWPP